MTLKRSVVALVLASAIGASWPLAGAAASSTKPASVPIQKKKSAPNPIEVSQLPAAVTHAVNAAYPGAKISRAAKITAGSTVDYEVHVKPQKGSQAVRVTLSADGKILGTKKKKS